MFDEHGGGCCGISHVYWFPEDVNETWLNQQMTDAIEEVEDLATAQVERGGLTAWKGKFGHAIEVCLTDDQMVVWAVTLKKKGFKLGLRWLNNNSGNYCNLLSWAPKKAHKKRPYKW